MKNGQKLLDIKCLRCLAKNRSWEKQCEIFVFASEKCDTGEKRLKVVLDTWPKIELWENNVKFFYLTNKNVIHVNLNLSDFCFQNRS